MSIASGVDAYFEADNVTLDNDDEV